jgi:hypothetical protein
MRILSRLVFVPLLLLAAGGLADAGDVRVSLANGLVTIVATDASPRQILAEWARLGQIRVANLERLAGAPLTLQLRDVPETKALQTVLRGTAGYVAVPRGQADGVASSYDRILLLPGMAPTLSASTAVASSLSTRERAVDSPAVDASDEDDGAPEFRRDRQAERPGAGRQPSGDGTQGWGGASFPGATEGGRGGMASGDTGTTTPSIVTPPPQPQSTPSVTAGRALVTPAQPIGEGSQGPVSPGSGRSGDTMPSTTTFQTASGTSDSVQSPPTAGATTAVSSATKPGVPTQPATVREPIK